jgi:hypothetical protein
MDWKPITALTGRTERNDHKWFTLVSPLTGSVQKAKFMQTVTVILRPLL